MEAVTEVGVERGELMLIESLILQQHCPIKCPIPLFDNGNFLHLQWPVK